MKKIKNKIQQSKILSVVLIVCVTVAYLFVTSSFAQGDKTYVTNFTPSSDSLELVRSPLSFGDVWELSSDSYSKSYYGQPNNGSTPTIYGNSGANNDSTVSQTVYSYYGYVKIADHAGLDSTSKPLAAHSYGDFWNYYTEKEIDTAYSDTDKIPVLEADAGKYATYSMIPESTGAYRIYIYSSENPTGKVQGTFIDNYASLNALETGFNGSEFTIKADYALLLSFTNINGTSWWYATVDLSKKNLDWTGYSVNVEAKADASSSKTDQIVYNNGSTAGITTNNCTYGTLLTDSDTYRYNIWTVNDVKFKSMLVLQWNSSVKLGPVTKMDKIKIASDNDTTDGYAGTLEVTNIFGEVLSVDAGELTTPHAPLYMIPAPDGGSFYDGFNVPGVTKVDDTQYYRWDFETTTDLCVQWAEPDPLPVITVSGNGYSATSDFYTVPTLNASYIGGSSSNFVITPDFADIVGATILYTISEPGKESHQGTITDTLSVPVLMDVVTVTLTAKSSSGTERTCVVTLTPTDDPDLPMVAKNTATQKEYRYIEDALMEAQSGETVVVVADASFKGLDEARRNVWSLENAGYTIDTGVQFLIPCRDADTGVWGAMPTDQYAISFDSSKQAVSADTPFAYRTLTIPEGITLICDGAMNVNGHRREEGQGAAGTGSPRGGHGRLVLSGAGTQLIVNGKLYCYGFIAGTGTTEISSSAELRELMQIYDWAGGSNATKWNLATILSKDTSLFFSTRYFVQNVEAPLKVYAGATLYMEAVLTASGTAAKTSAVLAGPSSSSNGLFLLGEGIYLIREYDPQTDRMTYSSGGTGTVRLGSINVTASGVSLKSSDYILGINSAISIRVGNGVTVELSQRFALLPGSELIVDQGGKVKLSGRIYIVDKADLKDSMSFGAQKAPLYTVGRGTTVKLNVTTSGRLEINGTLEIQSGGAMYTTTGASNVDKKIFGTGKIVNNGTFSGTASIQAGYSSLETINATSVITLIQGVSASDTDLQALGKNTYYGTGEIGKHYWYIPSLPVYSTNNRNDETFTIDAEYRLQDYLWLNAICYLGEATKKFDLSTGSVKVFTMNPDGSGYVNEYTNGKFTENEGVQILAVDGAIYLIKKIPSDEIPDDITFRIEYTDVAGKLYSSIPFTVHLSNCKNGDTETDDLVDALLEYGDAAKKYFVTGGVPDSVLTYGNAFTSTVTGSKEKEANAEQSYDNKTLKLSGMNFLFEERLALMVAMKFSSSVSETWIKNNVLQMGILVCDKTVDSGVNEIVLTTDNYSEYGKAVILYGAAKDANTSNIPILPDAYDYPAAQKKTLSAAQVAAQLNGTGYATIYMDLLSAEYTSSFKIRPFAIMKDGSVLYASQYEYGLGAYIKTMLAKDEMDLEAAIGDKDVDAFRNLLVSTWKYATKAVAYCKAQQN